MIPLEKLREIARKLIEKSRNNKAEWKPAALDYDFGQSGSFEVVFPRSRVRIRFVTPETETDYYKMDVLTRENRTIASWHVDAGSPPASLTEDVDLLKELYSEAERYVTGWDLIVEDIEESLLQDRVGGTNEGSEEIAEKKPTPPADDIPF